MFGIVGRRVAGVVVSSAAVLSLGTMYWLRAASDNFLPAEQHHAHAFLHSAADSAAYQAEQALLQQHVVHSRVDYLPVYIDPPADSALRRLVRVPAASEGRDHQLFLHGYRATDGEPGGKPILVLVHGWSSGSALWARLLDKLTPVFDVYAFDLLGFGQSSRPRFLGDSPDDARTFWLESFDLWRQQALPAGARFSLLGHSLGGWLTCAWAAAGGDQHLDSLYLAAPVGIAPWQLSADTPLRRLLAHMIWDWGVTPQGLLRGLGPFAQRAWDSLGERARYRELDEACWRYLGHLQLLPGSGDRVFMKLLERTGWGDPLLDRLDRIRCPARIIYGEHDYVRFDFGPVAVKHLTSSPHADYTIISDVGHHMYWRESDAFARCVTHFHERVVRPRLVS